MLLSICVAVISFAVAAVTTAVFDSSWPSCPATVFPRTITCNPAFSNLDCVCPLRAQRQWGDILLLRMVEQCGIDDTQRFLDVAESKCAPWSATATFALLPSTVTEATPWPTVIVTSTTTTRPATTETITTFSKASAETTIVEEKEEEITALLTTSISRETSTLSSTGDDAQESSGAGEGQGNAGNGTAATSGATAPLTSATTVSGGVGGRLATCWSPFGGSVLVGSVAFAVVAGLTGVL